MGKKNRERVADVAQTLADATAPIPASLLRPPGVVITAPEDLAAADRLPYAKADRTPAGPLQMLEEFAAHHLDLDPGRLVSMWGQICERGSVVAFRITVRPGSDETASYVVTSYEPEAAEDLRVGSLAVADKQIHEHGGKFRVAVRSSEHGTLAAYQRRIGELS